MWTPRCCAPWAWRHARGLPLRLRVGDTEGEPEREAPALRLPVGRGGHEGAARGGGGARAGGVAVPKHAPESVPLPRE